MAGFSRDNRFIKDKDFNFSNLLKEYLSEQEFISCSNLFISISVTLIFIFFITRYNLYAKVEGFYNYIISGAVGVLGIIIAAFGLFAAITDKEFSTDIYKLGQLGNILFPFWLCSALWIVNLISTILFYVIFNVKLNKTILKFMIFTPSFLFMISLLYTLSLIGDIIKLTIRRTQLNIINNVIKDKSKILNLDNEQKCVKRYNTFFMFYTILSLVIILCFFIWYYYLKSNTIFNLLSGAIWITYVFIGYKFYRIINQKYDIKLIRNMRRLFKIIIFLFCLWIGIFVI